MRRTGRRAVASAIRLASVLAVATFLSACGGEDSGGDRKATTEGAAAMSPAELMEHLEDRYSPEEGTEMVVDCPDELAADEGATAACEIQAGEGLSGVRFTTTDVSGSELDFDTQVFLPAEEVARVVSAQLEAQNFTVTSMECPEDLEGTVGETVTCTGVSLGQEGRIRTEVKSVDGLLVQMAWRVLN